MATTKEFNESDIINNGAGLNRINADKTELLWAPPAWLAAGLQETATGYGKRLNTGYKIKFNGRLYRVYCTCFSNCGTCWFVARGKRIIVS